MPFQQAMETLAAEGQTRDTGPQPFADQAARFQNALDMLASTLQSTEPDVTIIFSNDQDEWFYEHNMPRFAIY